MPKVISEHDMAPGRIPAALAANRFYLYCPGCYQEHKAHDPEAGEAHWMRCARHVFDAGPGGHQFNGNMDAPTLSPSLLVTGTTRCHSFILGGQIQFLSDCTHPLAGTTHALLDAPDDPK